MSSKEVLQLFKCVHLCDDFPDLRDGEKWPVEKLVDNFGLSEDDAKSLHWALGNQTTYDLYHLPITSAVHLLEDIQEALHMSWYTFEGYTDEEGFAVWKFIHDMSSCVEMGDKYRKEHRNVYIHVHEDDGTMVVNDDPTYGAMDGWVYKTDSRLNLIIPLDKLGDVTYVYEVLSDSPDTELVIT